MKNILIVFGGITSEHDLSCKSGGFILDNIDRTKYTPIMLGITRDGKWYYTEATPEEIRQIVAWEKSSTNRKAMLNPDMGANELIVFETDGNIKRIHIDGIFARMAGNTGEDGKLQGLFEISGIPYVGCSVVASACGMDKEIPYSFADLISMRRPQLITYSMNAKEKIDDSLICSLNNRIMEKMGYPVFVKPASTGSSMGISKVHSEEELLQAITLAFDYDNKVLIEENIEGTEVKVGLLGNANPVFGAICQLKADGEFNDFSTKYIKHTSIKQIPAKLPEETIEKIKEYALAYWKKLGCRGFSRIDFFLTKDNEIVFNEINTMPGFNSEGLYVEMFKAVGYGYTDIITKLIELSFEK